jgi:hypothetical protein
MASVEEPEPHHFDEARALTRCGSGPMLMINMGSFQKFTKTVSFYCFFSMPFYNNFHYTESEGKKMSDLLKC